MKKQHIIAAVVGVLFLIILMVSCGSDKTPPPAPVAQAQPQPQVVYQQAAPQPIIVQAPVAAPQQSSGDSGTAMIAGAAMGALAMQAISNNNQQQQAAYQQPQPQVTHVTKNVYVTQVAKETPPVPAPVAKPVLPEVKPMAAQIQPTPLPITPSYKPANVVTPTMAPAKPPEKKMVDLSKYQTVPNFNKQVVPTPTPKAKVDYSYKAPAVKPVASKTTVNYGQKK